MRLTILQQGETIRKNNTLDPEVIKELRTIRDKVNRVLDMVAVETSQAATVDIKAEVEVEETVTEAVSQLQLEQSKEFDPLEQSQVQVSPTLHRAANYLRHNHTIVLFISCSNQVATAGEPREVPPAVRPILRVELRVGPAVPAVPRLPGSQHQLLCGPGTASSLGSCSLQLPSSRAPSLQLSSLHLPRDWR